MHKRILSYAVVAIALLAFAAAAPIQAQETVTHTGEVGEGVCANQGRMGPDHAGCAKSCISRGGDMVLLVAQGDGHEMLVLRPNPDDDGAYESLKELAGHAATVSGYMTDEDDHQVFVVTAAGAATT